MSKGILVAILLIIFSLVAASFTPPASAQQGDDRKEQGEDRKADIERWIKALGSPDPKVSMEAARALEKLKEQALPAVPTLLRLLDEPRLFGPASRAAIHRPTPATEAFDAIVKIGPAALPALTTALQDSSLDSCRNIMSVLRHWPLNRTLDTLLTLVSHPKPLVRALALNNLWPSTDWRAIDVRITALKDPDPAVRIAAVTSLRAPFENFGEETPRYSDGDRINITYFLLPLLSEPKLRDAVISTLGTLAVPDAIEPILPFLDDPDYQRRQDVIRTLGMFRHPRATLPLIRLLTREHPELVEVALRSLGQIGDPRAVRPLCGLLKSQDSHLRAVAADALGEIKDRTAFPALMAVLEDEAVWVRQSAITALGKLRDSRAVPVLTALVEKRELLSPTAAYALGSIGDLQAVPVLVKALFEGGDSGLLQKAALDALGEIKSAEIIPLLAERALQQPSEVWSLYARILIGRLVGVKGFDISHEAFQRWWEENKAAHIAPSDVP
jgi:HEAT repeat protein